MRYASVLQVVIVTALVAVCFVPWVYIPAIGSVVTGMNAAVVNFGRPGIMTIFFTVLSLALYFMPGMWPKRINVFICSFNISWAVRNYILFTQCEMGECPEKRWGIIALLILSGVLLLLSFFPQVKSKVPPTP